MATSCSKSKSKSKSPPLNGKKPKSSSNGKTKHNVDDSNQFITINKWMKLDLKTNVLLSNCEIDSGTRILIELPLFKIGVPPQTSHPGNSLFLYHKFLRDVVDKKLREEILFNKYPLKKLNKNISDHTNKLKKLLKKNNNLSKNSPIKYNEKQWNEMEILLNIFHSYSISLNLLSDPYGLVYDHYNNQRFDELKQEKEAKEKEKEKGKQSSSFCKVRIISLNNNSSKSSSNLTDDTDHIIHLGKGLYNRGSHLKHACNPCCRINVIDEKGTIEIRTLIDIPSNIPLTRNFLDDTRGLGTMSDINMNDVSNTNPYATDSTFARLLMNDDINLIPCNLRCELLLKNYHFICLCPKCKDWDRTKGFLCSNASFSNGCKGTLWSRPPYLTFKCQSCHRLINRDQLSKVMEFEKKFTSKLKGIEELIDYKFTININKLIYPLLNECSKYLAPNHWIIIRILWICFEANIQQNTHSESIHKALIYLKRHIELGEQVNNDNHIPSIIMANKYELLSDLLSFDELYKQKAIKRAMEIRQAFHGDDHGSVKRCKNKLKFYKIKYELISSTK